MSPKKVLIFKKENRKFEVHHDLYSLDQTPVTKAAQNDDQVQRPIQTYVLTYICLYINGYKININIFVLVVKKMTVTSK